jgi:hypothetical protein
MKVITILLATSIVVLGVLWSQDPNVFMRVFENRENIRESNREEVKANLTVEEVVNRIEQLGEFLVYEFGSPFFEETLHE